MVVNIAIVVSRRLFRCLCHRLSSIAITPRPMPCPTWLWSPGSHTSHVRCSLLMIVVCSMEHRRIDHGICRVFVVVPMHRGYDRHVLLVVDRSFLVVRPSSWFAYIYISSSFAFQRRVRFLHGNVLRAQPAICFLQGA